LSSTAITGILSGRCCTFVISITNLPTISRPGSFD
jgi:hypothetical protein